MQKVGAYYLGNGKSEFNLWAPFCETIELKTVFPKERIVQMDKIENGYFKTVLEDAVAGTKYFFRLPDSSERPDPASFFQPDGVHKPSQIVDHGEFKWRDAEWKGIRLEEMIIYEAHVGTFTKEGSFQAMIPRLDELKDLGINSIEIMPVSQFPGNRNWGYDGVHPFSVQNSYGGPGGLKSLIDHCHQKEIAVILDVVYNHIGPEGNYFGVFGPYFTDRYKTPWGSAINFDGPLSGPVRDFFIQNALYWFKYFHIDALRIDAVHSIFDFGAKHFLRALAEETEKFSRQTGRKFLLIAESDLNDVRVIDSPTQGGFGIDSQWCDDFHHAVHTLLTGESAGYYEDFGRMEQLVKNIREGFVYSWEFSPHRKRFFGSSSKGKSGCRFVVCIQNHDQIGNRMLGERLSNLVSFDALKLAAGILLVSPYIPMLFMGEEFGADSPFLYFVSHGDENLIKAVREGRKKEFSAFVGKTEPPDPQADETFIQSKLPWEKRVEGNHQVLLSFYQALIRLRKTSRALSSLEKEERETSQIEGCKVLLLHRWHFQNGFFGIFNFENSSISYEFEFPPGDWVKKIDSTEQIWLGDGSSVPLRIQDKATLSLQPFQVVLFEKENPDA